MNILNVKQYKHTQQSHEDDKDIWYEKHCLQLDENTYPVQNYYTRKQTPKQIRSNNSEKKEIMIVTI